MKIKFRGDYMIAEVKEFLQEMEKNDSEQYFLFARFYFSPDQVLGGDEEETLKEYYKFGDIEKFILNNDFFRFLKVCSLDPEFNKRLHYNLLRKIRFILFDSRDFKKEYLEDLEDLYLREFCQGRVPLGPIYAKKYKKIELYGIIKRYEKCGWIYDVDDHKEKLAEIDEKLLDELIYENGWNLDICYDTEIRPIEDRKMILERIKMDDYSDPFNCFLAARGGHDKRAFKNLVCDNEFLEITSDVLMNKMLPEVVINNIVDILEVGINFKMGNEIYDDFWILYGVLGEEKVANFDYRRAIELQELLDKKMKNSKVVKFQKKNKNVF